MICSNSRSEKKSFIFSNLIPNVQKSSCQEKLKTIQIFAKLLFYEYQNIHKGILILKIYQREESALKKLFKMPKNKTSGELGFVKKAVEINEMT